MRFEQRMLLCSAIWQYPDLPQPCNELGAQLIATGRTRAALRHYERALARSEAPDDDNGWDASINLALCLVDLAEKRPQSEQWLSRLPEAREHVHRCIVSTPSDTRLLDLLDRADALAPRAESEAHAIWRTVTDASVSHQRRSGAAIVRSWQPPAFAARGEALLICFAGADANLGGGIRGGMPSHEFVASCRRAGIGRAVFVRDALRAWYLRGIGEVDAADTAGGDCAIGVSASFDGVVQRLALEVAALRPSRVVTIGSSMGGYAAVRAGLALNADAAVAFSPQVLIDASHRAALALPPAPFDKLLTTLHATSAAVGAPLTSLAECVEAAPCGCTTAIEVHAGATEDGDVREAQLLVQAVDERRRRLGGGEGELSCALTLHDGRDHNLVKEMRDAGELHDLLRRVAGLELDAPPTAAEPQPSAGIAAGFVGFEDCGDF